MASGSNYLTTYYAKRIIGDSAASNATSALLQTGTNITSNIWILNHTKRLEDSPSKTYGIKYIYDSSAHDKLEIHGKTSSDNATAWVQLDTGDVYILGNMGIGAEPNTHKLYVGGNAFFSDIITIHKNGEGSLVISDGTHYNDDTFRVVLDLNPTSGNHGIWSSGYMNNGTFTSESKWMLIRGSDGEVQMNGNASTATKLETPRKINNTNFDGSADITTDRWGTARNITIKDADSTNAGTAVSVNGSAAVTLLLPSTIKASLSGNATSANYLSTYVANSSSSPKTIIDGLQRKFADIPKSVGTAVKVVLGSHYMGFGYFLSGDNYNTTSTAYGGWFVAAYDVPHYIGISNGNWSDFILLHSGSWRKTIFANKNVSRSTLTVSDSSWAVTSGTDVFGLSFKDTGLTYTPSGGSATASSDTGDLRMWLTCASTSNTVSLNMRIDGTFQSNGFIGGSYTGTYFYSKHDTIDITASNNGVTSNTAAYGYYGLDKNGKDFTRVMPYVLTSGETRLYLQIRNHSGSAYTSYGGIIIKQGKSANTITYEVTEGANFRSAIGAGTSSLTIGTTASTAAAGNHNHDSTYLKLAGGTMTGSIIQKLTGAARQTKPSANQYRTYEFQDNGGNRMAQLEYGKLATGETRMNLYVLADAASDTNTYGGIYIYGAFQNTTAKTASYNINTGIFTATGFSGPLTGNVTGNCSGSSGSCTGNAATVSRATFGDKDNAEHNANSITSNGLYYYTSNGPATDVNQFKSTDGAIYCQAYNTTWVAQIAQDYRNGSLAVRGKNNGTWSAWLSIPKMKVESYPALLPANGENNWIKVGTSNTSYGLLPSQSGAAGSGHNYLGTSSWYWKYAYVDEIYGHLNGNCTGSSGSCTGNAVTATKATQDSDGNTIKSTYLKLSGGTLTGTLTGTRGIFTSGTDAKADSVAAVALITGDSAGTHLEFDGNEIIAKTNASTKGALYLNESCTISADGETVTSTTFSGNATTASKVGAAASWLYFNNNNELNFGGTYSTDSTIYIGYRATDSRPKPTIFSFGGGEAQMNCGQIYISASKHIYMKYSSTNYAVLYNHNNGNISLRACGAGLYIGYENTTLVNWLNGKATLNSSGEFSATKVKNAVWNDYAECRHSNELEPGRCVTETSTEDGMTRTTERLMPGCKFVSDTYGTLMGETEEAKTPIAVSGRVLAYPYRNKEEYPLGAAVCSAPNGTIDIMTRDEIMMYPERIVGTVSEIPDYDIWHGGSAQVPTDIQVNGRIWIYVR